MPNLTTTSEVEVFTTVIRLLAEGDDMGLRTAAETAYSLIHGAEAMSIDHFCVRPGSKIELVWSGLGYSLSWDECGDGCTKVRSHRGLHHVPSNS